MTARIGHCLRTPGRGGSREDRPAVAAEPRERVRRWIPAGQATGAALRRLCAAVALVALGSMPCAAVRSQLNIPVGDPFPDMTFDPLLAPEDYGRLGLGGTDGPVRLSAVPGDLLVLEFFNQYCMSCQRQAPYLESFLRAVEAGDLARRVRVLAVAVGNRPKPLHEFRREFSASYPIAPDPLFDRFLEVGDPGGTPFTLFLLRRDAGWILADYHMGLQGDTELMARSRVLLERPRDLRAERVEGSKRERYPALAMSEAERAERARTFLGRVQGKDVGLRAVELPGRGTIFEALGPDGKGLGLYARIASRDPVCDLCHAVHFLFAFDGEGRARGFEPIHVTKWGNEVWSAEDSSRMEGTLRGRPLAGLAFDPEVDAVTSATMSSALIFDEVRRAAAMLPELASR